MHLTRPAAFLLTAVAVACSPSSDADPGPGPALGTPSVIPTSAAPNFPADATFADGATATIPLKASRGNLFVAVESRRTPKGTTTTFTVSRQKDCHIDDADGEAGMFVCTTVYNRRKALPAGAFTFDSTLGTSKVTTTVEGKRFEVIWTGYGDVRRKVNQNGNLLVEARDAKATTTWGSFTHTDRDGTDVPSSLYRRVTAKRG